MVRTLRFGPQDRPQVSRILGIAATITLHIAALMLLLIPLTGPRITSQVEAVIKPRWIVPEVVPVTPPPPLIPNVQTPSRPQPKNIAPAAPSVPAATVESAPYVETAPALADPQPATELAPIAAPMTGPVALSSLAYISAPPPPYPSPEARAGIEGTVTLRILVGSDGIPLEVSIDRSSGNRNLDRAAQRHVKDKWRFQPAVRDGHAVQAYGLVPIAFSLQ